MKTECFLSLDEMKGERFVKEKEGFSERKLSKDAERREID